MKMEQTECSETSSYKIQTPRNYPEESIQDSEHGISLKSRIIVITRPVAKKLLPCTVTVRSFRHMRLTHVDWCTCRYTKCIWVNISGREKTKLVPDIADSFVTFNPLNPELNPICYLLALLGAHHFLHVSRIRVKSLTLRLLMSYIYIWSTYSWCF